MAQLPYDEYIKTVPRKITAVGVLFFNTAQQLLIVKPTYKPLWSIVGGVVDAFESPLAAAIREIKEEIGLNINDLNFLLVDFCNNKKTQVESLQFIFSAPVLTAAQIAAIVLPANELSEYRFCDLADLPKHLSAHQFERVMMARKTMENNRPVYHENIAVRL